MKITVSATHLLEGLKVLEKITARHPSLPLLEAVLLSIEGKNLVIRATNLDSGLEYVLPATVSAPGKCACLPHLVISALSGSESEDVSLELVDGTLHVVTQSGEVFIKTLPPDDFPTLPRPSKDHSKTLSINTRDLSLLLRSVVFSVSQSELKPELACVYVAVKNNTLISVGTDAFRLAEKRITSVDPIPESEPILVPGRVVQDFLKILDALPDQELALVYSDTQISFQTGFWFVTGRLVQGNYPNYAQIIPKNATTKAVVFRKDIQTLLKPLALFSDKDLRMDIKFDPSKKAIICTTDSHDIGRAQYKLTGAIEGEPLEVRVNYKYVNDILSQIHDESIRISSAGGQSPLVIEPIHDQGFLYLVMPMYR